MAEQVAKWDALRQRAADPNAATFVDSEGRIEVFNKADLGEAQQAKIATRGLKAATAEDIEARAKHLENATSENQTRAAIELGLNTATAGAIGKEDFGAGAEERRSAFEKESPGLALATRIAGGIAPMALTGGLAGAAGLGRVAVGAAEGLGVGLAEENAQAAWENRELSAGNVALAGLGGALFSGAIPAVIRRGSKLLGKADDAVAAAAGEVGENVGPRLEANATARSARSVSEMAPGPARDALLRQDSKAHLERAGAEIRDVATRAGEAMGKADLDSKTLRKLMPKNAPVQTEWATRTAEELRKLAGAAAEGAAEHPHAGMLRSAAESLLESKGGFDTMQRARAAITEMRRAGVPEETFDALRKGVTDQSLFGRAAEAVADFESATVKLPKSALEGFDPGNLTQAARERLGALAESLEDRAAARAKWDVGGGKDGQAKRLLADAARVRKAIALSDDVAGSVAREAEAEVATAAAKPAASAFQSATRGFGNDLVQEGAEYALESLVGSVIPGSGLLLKMGRRMWSGIDASGRESLRQAARGAARGALRAAGTGVDAVRRAAPTALERFAGDFPGPQEAFAARRDMLLEMSRDPTVLPRAMAESFGDLPRENPKLFQAIATRMAKASAYVTANLPAGVATSITHPRGVKPSHDTLRDFAVVWNSAMHPESVVDSVEDGSASPEQIRALKTIDPDSYAQLVQDVTAEVGQNYEQTTSQTKQWLDILFDSDGIAGPAYSWAAADYMAEANAKNAGQPAPMGAMPLPSEQAPTNRSLDNIAKGVTNRGA